MRVRRLDANNDMVFGHGKSDFYQDEVATVAQSIQTRMQLWLGQWFLDKTAGMDWRGKVLGYNTAGTRDAIIRERILGTQGVVEIVSYQSRLDSVTRAFTVTTTVKTIYGQQTVVLPL